MTDMSTKVRKGYKGDASVLCPTMMCAVPLIMDRIYKNIIDSVNKRGPAFKKVFEYCYEYKRYWMERGRNTPVCDKIVFNKIRALLGGRMRYVIVGGAPLSKETHEFIRICLGISIVQVKEGFIKLYIPMRFWGVSSCFYGSALFEMTYLKGS
jgi:long-chain acyl-CoA synthetase